MFMHFKGFPSSRNWVSLCPKQYSGANRARDSVQLPRLARHLQDFHTRTLVHEVSCEHAVQPSSFLKK